MSDINLPTKSEINGDKEKESEVITLNIYNNNINFTETTDNINQTEENLYIKDNYNNLIKQKNNNIVYYDNVREKSNNYPLSENRRIQSTTHINNNNNYYKSVNPYIKNNNYQIINNQNINLINIEEKKRPIIYHPKSKIKQQELSQKEQKNKKHNIFYICCVGILLLSFIPPFGFVFCIDECSKR